MYPQAISDLTGVNMTSYIDLQIFLGKFRNIVVGIQKMHSLGLVHHDLKPLNILVLGSTNTTNKPRRQTYKISDLDSINAIADFNSTSVSHVTRLTNNWCYNYFPASVVLLLPITDTITAGKQLSRQIDLQTADMAITEGLKSEDNQSYYAGMERTFNSFKQHINKLLQNDPMNNKFTSILDNINSNKFGSSTSEADTQKLVSIIHQIHANISSEFGASNMESFRDILVKYVDIYGLSMCLYDMIFQLLSKMSAPLDSNIINTLERIFTFMNVTLTYLYFEKKHFNMNIVDLYDKIIMST
jgi:serine/threonine protein kinase